MSANEDDFCLHPLGELEEDFDSYPPPQKLDTFGGMIEVHWEEVARVGMHCGPAFSIEFLKVSGIWEKFAEECPLKQVLSQFLGIGKLHSEDSVRQAFEKQIEEALTLRMDRQMNETYAALLDQDATVKTLYGHQEEARVGYNPMKSGRPSHVYHAKVLTAANRIASPYA